MVAVPPLPLEDELVVVIPPVPPLPLEDELAVVAPPVPRRLPALHSRLSPAKPHARAWSVEPRAIAPSIGVEPHVVERAWRVVGRQGLDHAIEEAIGQRPIAEALEVPAEDHPGEELADRGVGVERRRRLLQPRLHLDEPGGPEPLGRLLRRGEVVRRREAAHPGRVLRLGQDGARVGEDAVDVARAAELRDEAPARCQRAVQGREEPQVVVDPVQRRRAEDRVHGGIERKPPQVGLDEGDAIPVPRREFSPRLGHHVRALVDRHHVPPRQSLEQFGRQPAGAAARVGDALVASQRQALQNPPAPCLLRGRDTVVGSGVPLLRGVMGHAAEYGGGRGEG